MSYSRFIHKMKNLFISLFAFLLSDMGALTGIAFIDSTSLAVCHRKRIHQHKVFKKMARRGKTTAGWFYVFKLHLIINGKGEILAFQLTPGKVADVSVMKTLSMGIFGKLFGDKGYISAKLAKELFKRGLQLFTTFRSNIKAKPLNAEDRILLRKRSLLEKVSDH